MYALVSCHTFQSNLIGISAIALTDDFIKKCCKNCHLQIDVQRSAKVIVVARNMCTTIIVTKDAGRDPTYLEMEGSLACLIKLILP